MSADEFDIIAKYFAPLAGKGARGLMDDVATLGNLVLTTDAIVEGVHFLADDPIDTIAKKALRVNLSDLAAKGAQPVGVLLTLVWPNTRPSAQLAAFACGLSEDLRHFNVPLLGGDTSSTPGPLTISITAIGEALGNRTPSRVDAIIGDKSGSLAISAMRFLACRASPLSPSSSALRPRISPMRTRLMCAIDTACRSRRSLSRLRSHASHQHRWISPMV